MSADACRKGEAGGRWRLSEFGRQERSRPLFSVRANRLFFGHETEFWHENSPLVLLSRCRCGVPSAKRLFSVFGVPRGRAVSCQNAVSWPKTRASRACRTLRRCKAHDGPASVCSCGDAKGREPAIPCVPSRGQGAASGLHSPAPLFACAASLACALVRRFPPVFLAAPPFSSLPVSRCVHCKRFARLSVRGR